MGDWIDQLIAESQERFRQAWSQMALAGPSPVVQHRGDYDLAIAGLTVGLFNAAFPQGPIAGLSRLREMATACRDLFAERRIPGMITLPSSWLPPGGDEVLIGLGFMPEIRNAGMRTARLADPQYYPTPHPVVRLDPARAATVMAEVNANAYGMSAAEAMSMVLPEFWGAANLRSYAVEDDGVVAAVGAGMRIEDCCYILWMATRTQARRRGFAEKIIRQAWEDARQDGAKLTVLHATPAGRPLYARMGYARIADFPGYVWTPPPAG